MMAIVYPVGHQASMVCYPLKHRASVLEIVP